MSGAEPAAPRIRVRHRVLASVLLALVAVTAYGEVSRHRLERELRREAAICAEEVGTPGFEAKSVVTVSRAYLVVGPATGKVEVYLRKRGDDTALPAGYEFYFERKAGHWLRTESGRCSSEQCVLRAEELFAQ